MREAWADERLDDLSERVSDLGRRMDAGFAEQREELRSEIGGLRGEFQAELWELNRTLLRLGAGMIGLIVTMALGFLGVIATVS